MLYLNTRHRLPQIAIRQQWGRFTEAAAVPATVHGNNEQARSNKGVTQPTTDIDNYPSRRALGFRNMDDYTRERGEKGLSDVQAAISKKAQNAWSNATTAARKGNDIHQKAKSDMMSQYTTNKIVFELNLMPEPTITAHESEIVGEPDEGDVTAEIEPVFSPKLDYIPGRAETYLADKGFIRHWVTEGHYDIYA